MPVLSDVTDMTLPSIRVLDRDAGLRTRLQEILGTQVSMVPERDADVIGVVRWGGATKDEVAALGGLRQEHDGPIVAMIDQLPTVRGARAVTVLLDGAVLAEQAPYALLPTLLAVAAGQCVVPAELRRLLERPALSPRERQVLALVVLDFSNAEIARRLVVTESAVKSHLTSAFGKLGVSSRSAAVELILDSGSGLAPGIIRLSAED